MNEIYSNINNDFNDREMNITSSRNGDTVERLHSVLSLSNPRQRWTTIRTPAISPALSFAELIYLLSGSDEASIINAWNPLLPKYQGKYSKYPGAYGNRLKNTFGFDQIKCAYEALLYESNSRQVLLDIWNPEIDLPKEHGKPNNKDIPCNVISMLKIRNDRLYWSQIMRSNDLYLGLPYDVLLFSSLQEIMAGWLNIDVGNYTHYCDSLHYYISNKMSVDATKMALFNTDDLRLEKTQSDEVFSELFAIICELGNLENIDKYIKETLESISFTEAYNNILMIICLYMLNKKSNDTDLIKYCFDRCTNDLYVQLYKEWQNSKK